MSSKKSSRVDLVPLGTSRARWLVCLVAGLVAAAPPWCQAVQAERPERIISLSPSVTEILYGIGAFGRVVAVSQYCDYPPEAENLPRVGAWMNTNMEQIAALRPDLIIMADAQESFVQEEFDSLGLASLVVPSQSLDDVFAAIEAIGRAVGNQREAETLERETRAGLEAVRLETKSLTRPRVLTVVDRLPGTLRDLYVATRGSYLVELIEMAGGRPIAPPAPMGYTRITTEAVVSFDPEVILDIVQTVSDSVSLLRGSGSLAEDPIAVWSELEDVRAVRDGRVYTIPDKFIVHPSQFVVETARRIARILHPEAFRE